MFWLNLIARLVVLFLCLKLLLDHLEYGFQGWFDHEQTGDEI